MVRIKYRYLLVHILNPEPALPKAKIIPDPSDKTLPDLVQFHSPSPDNLTPQLLARAVKDQIQYLYGDYGLGLVSSSLNGTLSPLFLLCPDSDSPTNATEVKYLSPATSTALIRCSRDHYRIVWAALSFMTQLPKSPGERQARACVMQVVRVSGTIKKAEEELIRRARAAILRARRESGEGDVDGLVGLLGREERDGAVRRVEGNMSVESDGCYEDEEDEEMGVDSDEDG